MFRPLGPQRVFTATALVAVGLSLWPLLRLVSDYRTYERYLSDFPELAGTGSAADGFDWVAWIERDGAIEAGWVFPMSAADREGLHAGDRFYMFDYQQYFDVEDLRRAVRATRPGEPRTYVVERGGRHEQVSMSISRHPAFLYPRSPAIWQFGLWGFAVGAFVHLVALVVAAPLARRSREARFEFLLVAVSAVWIVGNLLRIVVVTLFGPPDAGTAFDGVFRGLTLAGLVGWIGFPLLLLDEVLRGARGSYGRERVALAVPAGLLALAVAAATLLDSIGPFTMESLLVPILFYASCYIAAAAGIAYLSHRLPTGETGRPLRDWGRVGSALILVVAVLAALSVQGVVPLLSSVGEAAAGWIVVSAQLLAVAPVALISFGTLRHGRLEDVVSRAAAYLAVLGLIFFVFVAGLSIIEPRLPEPAVTRRVVSGLYVVLLLLVADRLARRLRAWTRALFQSDRERGRQKLSLFQERMREIVDLETLCREAVDRVAEALQVRSAVLFLRGHGANGRWVSATFHPEPPYLTEQDFRLVWPRFEEDPRVWSGYPELDERRLPRDDHARLAERGAALAVPIRGEGRSAGLLVLGAKRTGRVYNLEDLDLLRSIGGQLAIAVERLALVEREKELAREASEAQLLALRSQINPHFLFNALNTIVAHIDERPDAAEATVEHLAAIFRFTLQAGEEDFVALQDEITLIRHYLAIEESRFSERLEVEIDVDPSLSAFPVPAFVVQTLVENAVKHGIERTRSRGRLTIRARADGSGAEIAVHDTGPGIPALYPGAARTSGEEAAPAAGAVRAAGEEAAPASGAAGVDRGFFGIGLRNVSARLRLHYGRDDLLIIRSDPESGTTAVLRIPGRDGAPSSTSAS